MTTGDIAAGTGPDEDNGRPVGYVQSLERGLAVIRAFDADHPRLTLSEVARRADLTRAAARRFLHTLVEMGYVDADGRVFTLRPRVLELGYAYLSALGLPELAQPHLERLATALHESASISVLDGTDITYVARVAARRLMSVDLGVGTRLPAYATSMGRVLLAELPHAELNEHLGDLRPLTRYTITDRAQFLAELRRVRDQGWSIVDEELEEGLRSIAAPVRDAGGIAVAALNVSTAARRGSISTMIEEILPALRSAATALSDDLAARR